MRFFFTLFFLASPLWAVCPVGISKATLFLPETVARVNSLLKGFEHSGVKICLEEKEGYLADATSKSKIDSEEYQLAQPDFIRVVFFKRPLSLGIYVGHQLFKKKLLTMSDVTYGNHLFQEIAKSQSPNSMDTAVTQLVYFFNNAQHFHRKKQVPPKLTLVKWATAPLLLVFSILSGLALALVIWGFGKTLLSSAKMPKPLEVK